jgi:hypothetical protein
VFGFCEFAKTWSRVLLIALLVPGVSWAQQKRAASERPKRRPAQAAPAKASSSQKGIIISEDAAVFDQPNFDAQIISTLKLGGVYDITRGKKDVFHKIRVKPGMTGWISEADVRPAGAEALQELKDVKAAEQKKARTAERANPVRGKKPIHKTRYRGLGLESMQFKEDTMNAVRTASVLLYGFRMSGPNTLLDGDTYTDSEFLFTTTPPSYYADATGNSATGFFFLGNFLFITDVPQSRTMMSYYGFGPTVRLTHFEATLSEPGSSVKKAYVLDDLTIGAVFNLGLALSFDRYALRADLRYYWETQQYISFAFGFQQDF